MHSDTVVTLSLRHWDRKDHTRFWLAELGPSVGVAASGLVAAAAIIAVVGTGVPVAVMASLALATCTLAFPLVVAWEVSRRRAPLGFEVVRSEMPATEYVTD